jgi:DNA polymerase-3 subunit beta
LSYLTKVKPLFAKQNSLAILDNICVKNGLFICSNLDITITIQTNAENLTGLFPFGPLYQIAKNEKEGPALLTIQEDYKFLISTETSVYNLIMTDVSIDNYPNLPEKDNVEYPIAVISTNELKKMIPFTHSDDLRPVLNGVSIGSGYMAASDTHMLTWGKIDYNGPAIILPKSIGNFLDKNSNIGICCYNLHNALIFDNDYSIFVHVIEGNYPNFMSVVPQNNNITMQTSKTQLIKMLKQAITQANQASRLIEFGINGSLKIKSQDIDFALAYNGQLACEHTGKDITIGFNGNKLLNCLSAIDTETVNFTFNDPLSPVIINNNILLMPLQIK